MKIDGLQPQNVYKSFTGSSVRSDDCFGDAEKKSAAGVSSDRVEISSESSDLSDARKLLSQSGVSQADGSQSSDRSEKVEMLKQQVESGEYDVSSKDIATSILMGRHFDSRA